MVLVSVTTGCTVVAGATVGEGVPTGADEGLTTTTVLVGELVAVIIGALVTVGKLGLIVTVGIGVSGAGFWAGTVGKIVSGGKVLVGIAIGILTAVGLDVAWLVVRVDKKSNTPI